MGTLIQLALSNFTVTCLLLGLIGAGISLWRQPKTRRREALFEALLAYFLLFSIGVSFLYNFAMHTFFAEMCARFIGWPNSPFQYEVGYASLGFSAVGFLAFRHPPARLAALLGPALFLWGAAGGHVYQMIAAHNFAPGNAGTIFWTDLFLPVIGFALYALNARTKQL